MSKKQPEEDINEFDELEQSLDPKQEVDPALSAKFERRTELIYHIFGKTSEGQELLKMWVEGLLVLESSFEIGNGHDLHSMGLIHGEQNFIRRIFKLIKLKQEEK